MRHSQKRKALERCRRRGARLLVAGQPQAEVARRVGVSRQTVMRWERLRQQGGLEALRRAEHFGRLERRSRSQCKELVRVLKAGSLAAGFATELWTLPRIARLIEEQFAASMVPTSVWRLLERLSAYAPEMNPVECIWGYLKHHAMPNYCATDFTDLAQRARRNLRSMQQHTTLVTAFWKQAELF